MPPPKRPHHPSAPPPPEAFGELPPSLEPFEPSYVRSSRTDNRDVVSAELSTSTRLLSGRPPPKDPPPYEAPEMQDFRGSLKSWDLKPEINSKSRRAVALVEEEIIQPIEETKKVIEVIEETNVEQPKTKSEQEREAEEYLQKAKLAFEMQMQNSKGSKTKKKHFGPSAPLKPPMKPVVIEENLIPRGRMEIEITRIFGLVDLGGMSAKMYNNKATLSMFMSCQMFFGTGYHRIQGQTPMWTSIDDVDDFEPTVENDANLIRLGLSEAIPAPVFPPDMPEKEKWDVPPILYYSIHVSETNLFGGNKMIEIAQGQVPAGQLFSETLRTQRALLRDGLDSSRWLGEDFSLPLSLPTNISSGASVHSDSPVKRANTEAFIQCRIKFVASKCGALSITTNECRNLRNLKTFLGGKVNIQAQLFLGTNPPTCGTIFKGAETDQYMGDEELVLWVDHATAARTPHFKIDVMDLTQNKPIGTFSTRLGSLIKSTEIVTEAVILKPPIIETKDRDLPPQELHIERKFYPSGELVCKIICGRNIRYRINGDCYVTLECHSAHNPINVKTTTCSAAGVDAIWNEVFVIDALDHYEIRFCFWEKGILSDDLIGEHTIELDALYRLGMFDADIPMKKKTSWGGFDDVGILVISLDFIGPAGFRFPMLCPTKRTYDDSQRKRRKGQTAAEREAILLKEQLIKEAEDAKRAAEEQLKDGGVFSDKEIQEAFDFLDLDHNLSVGAEELRHILTCMGELVTTAEIDTMIDMCDFDGDGQVSFFEMYQMARAADPGHPEWKPRSELEYRSDAGNGAGKSKPPPIIIYDANGKAVDVIDAATDAKARRDAVIRKNDNARKIEKRKLCKTLVSDLNVRMPELKHCFEEYLRMEASKRGDGFCTYDEMLRVLGVDGKVSYRDIFTLFAGIDEGGNTTGLVNIRELLLALNNFTGATKNQRVHFCFHLFDYDKSGEINLDELFQILRATNLSVKKDDPAIQAKAQSIMQQADKDGSGAISLDEFSILAQKFPSLILPDFETYDEKGKIIYEEEHKGL